MNSLPLIIVIAMAVVPSIVVLGVRLVLIVIHRGEEPERSRPWPAVRLRRAKRVIYVAGGLYALVMLGCALWWVAVDLAPRLGISVSGPFLAWGIGWTIIFLAFMIVPIVLRVRGLNKRNPPPGPDASEEDKKAWRDRYYNDFYAGNTLRNFGKLMLGVLVLAVLMGLSGWIVSHFAS